MPGELPLATVLLPGDAPMRPYRTADGKQGGVVDLSYLEFVVEALIAQSATNLAVSPESRYYEDHQFLPESLRTRICKVDKDAEAYEKAYAVLLPAIKETGITVHGQGNAFQVPDGTDMLLATAVSQLLIDLRMLLVGIAHRCQLPLDKQSMLSGLKLLQKGLSKPDSRANLAFIEGLLALYEPADIPGLHGRVGVESDHVRAFSQFVTDETYRAMSREAGLLGVPARATVALLSMRRKLAELLTHPKVADLYEAGTTSVEIATKMPTPKSPLLARLLNPDAGYLPPLVDLSAATARAQSDWVSVGPPLRVPRDLEHLLGSGDKLIVAAPDQDDFWGGKLPDPPPDLLKGPGSSTSEED